MAEGVVIRPEREADHPVIAEVVRAAFVGHPREVASFVERIRESDQSIPELALVAEDSSGVIAHVMLSWVGVEGASRPGILNLTPMSVRPDRQRIGVGAQLIRDALGRVEEAGEPAVMVEGIAAYYPRFGFERASALGFISPHPTIPDEAFMVSGDTAPTSPVGSSIRLRSTLSGTNDRPEKRSAATRKTHDDVRLDRPGQRWVSDGLSVSTAYGCTVRFDERGVVT
ncbi:MAG: N-acetyltransferase [Gaiella sp.]